MMYLTAHRVRHVKNGRHGINTFYYKHGNTTIPNFSWHQPNLQVIVESYPGELFAQNINIVPGNNHVMSYLDVVASDDITLEQVIERLDKFKERIHQDSHSFTDEEDVVCIGFGLQIGLGGHQVEEFETLVKQVLDLFNHPKHHQTAERLVVNILEEDQEVQFSLPQGTIQRLREIHGSEWQPTNLKIDHNTQYDFELFYGNIIDHLLPVILQLDKEQILNLGGVQINGPGGDTFLWPPVPLASNT